MAIHCRRTGTYSITFNFWCHCVLWVCGSVRSFKTPKGTEASFILFLWSHSGNCFWMLRLESYYFELNDAKHCVTLLGSFAEEWKLAFLSPTSKYVCKFVSNWQSLLIIIALKIRRTPRKPVVPTRPGEGSRPVFRNGARLWCMYFCLSR